MIYATYYICQEIRTLNVYEAVQAGELRNKPVFKDEYSSDPVFNCRYIYDDGGWNYVCSLPKKLRS